MSYLELLENVLSEVSLDITSDIGKKFKHYVNKIMLPNNGKIKLKEGSDLKITKDDLSIFFKYGLLKKSNKDVKITKKGTCFVMGGKVSSNKDISDEYFDEVYSKFIGMNNYNKDIGYFKLMDYDGKKRREFILNK